MRLEGGFYGFLHWAQTDRKHFEMLIVIFQQQAVNEPSDLPHFQSLQVQFLLFILTEKARHWWFTAAPVTYEPELKVPRVWCGEARVWPVSRMPAHHLQLTVVPKWWAIRMKNRLLNEGCWGGFINSAPMLLWLQTRSLWKLSAHNSPKHMGKSQNLEEISILWEPRGFWENL